MSKASTLQETVEPSFDRQQLAKFLQLNLDAELVFECEEGEGERIIQRMRVRLSKLKKKARRLKRTVKEFKMLVKSIAPIPDNPGQERVTLLKSESSITGIATALEELDNDFKGLTSGKMLEI